MKALIDVFRMDEISREARIKVLKRLGRLINSEHASNIAEPLVYELVLLLDPNDPIRDDEHYTAYL